MVFHGTAHHHRTSVAKQVEQRGGETTHQTLYDPRVTGIHHTRHMALDAGSTPGGSYTMGPNVSIDCYRILSASRGQPGVGRVINPQGNNTNANVTKTMSDVSIEDVIEAASAAQVSELLSVA